MLAAVLHDFNKLELQNVPEPRPRIGEVVVRIKACGFCATDYKAIKGIRRNVTFPLIAGHEPAGIVAAVGPAVTQFRENDEVIVMPSAYCGMCRHCRVGNTHYCEQAYTTGGDGVPDVRPGALAEYMGTAATALFHKPRQISFGGGALSGTDPALLKQLGMDAAQFSGFVEKYKQVFDARRAAGPGDPTGQQLRGPADRPGSERLQLGQSVGQGIGGSDRQPDVLPDQQRKLRESHRAELSDELRQSVDDFHKVIGGGTPPGG